MDQHEGNSIERDLSLKQDFRSTVTICSKIYLNYVYSILRDSIDHLPNMEADLGR